MQLANYQPISLTNADCKVLAYVLSNRLSVHLTNVIAVNQTAYMKGHFIGTNIRFVQDTMMHFAQSSSHSAVLFLDFKKAFDSVSHTFLFCLLWRMGFPLEFIQWVQIMYSDVSLAVHHNNLLTPSITLQHGV